ncbi:MAG TPA: hypothetical protein VEG34_18910, partial [Thermoanaerobaculia bacterium]|nr:hypothetical protein [Thermoanaerobaculia bacterium]
MTRRRDPLFRHALPAALLLLCWNLPLSAQEGGSAPEPTAVASPAPALPAPRAVPAAAAVPPAVPAAEPVVRGVRSDRDDQLARAGLGDRIAVQVDRLDLLLART